MDLVGDQLPKATDVSEGGDDEDDGVGDADADSNEDELQDSFNRKTFVVPTRKLEGLPQWVRVTEVFKTDSDAAFLKRAG